MGMFDDIIIPKSYLTDILDKEDEKLFDTYHKFQTKDFEPMHGGSLDVYKLSRSQLSKQVKKDKWKKVTVTEEINFYTTFTSRDGDDYWFEFKFKFVKGKLDSKELIDRVMTNKETQEAIQRMWDIEQEIFDDYRQRWSYKFWTKVERCCQKFTVMARNRHLLPYDLRKTAYKASGRLEEDPDCLKWYQDI
jgi:hypothetical protein